MAFKNLKIGTKLISAFIAVALIAAIIGIIGFTQVNKLDEIGDQNYKHGVVGQVLLGDITEAIYHIRVDILSVIISPSIRIVENSLKSIEEQNLEMLKFIKDYEKLITDSEEKSFLEKFKSSYKNYYNTIKEAIILYKKNKDLAIQFIFSEQVNRIISEVTRFAAETDEVNEKIAKKAQEEQDRTAKIADILMISLTIVGFIIALILGILITRSITRPIKAISEVSSELAKGNLDHEKIIVNTKDEIGVLANSFNNALDSFNQLLSEVNGAVTQTATGAEQISIASQDLSQGASEQASALEELTASSTEISEQARQNALSVAEALEMARKAKEFSENANSQMKKLVDAMQDINRSSEDTKKIVKVIDDIAFQINLLALNANVEAARAGKYGKGFAVVADEVRNLANKSGNAVKETERMMEQSMQSVSKGNSLVESTFKQLEEINKGAEVASNLLESVTMAIKEQAQGLEQMNSGLEQIDQVTQSNTASAEESSAVAEELASQAKQLKFLVDRFKLRAIREIGTSIKSFADIPEELLEVIKNEIAKRQQASTGIPMKQIGMETSEKGVKPKDVIMLEDEKSARI